MVIGDWCLVCVVHVLVNEPLHDEMGVIGVTNGCVRVESSGTKFT